MKYFKHLFIMAMAGAICLDCFADTTPGDGAITGLYQEKFATPNSDGTYTLTIDSYATGSMVTERTTTSLQADIVMVIDMSSSMRQSQESKGNVSGTTVPSGLNKNIFYCTAASPYNLVRWNGSKWQKCSSGSWSDITSSTAIALCGYPAVITAAKRFVDNLYADAKKYGKYHRIKIYQFNANGATTQKCDFTKLDDTGYSTVMTALYSMSLGSGTFPADAFSKANTSLSSSTYSADANKGDTKNIVYFTDGAANGSDASKTINHARTAKGTNGINVFSIGYKMSTSYNDYLEAVSSNFLDAYCATESSSYTISNNAESNRSSSFYFRNSDDPMDLIDYFDRVAIAIAHQAKIYDLTTTTQIRDYITSDFKLPAGYSPASVSTFTVACTGFDTNGNPTFAGSSDVPITGLTIQTPNDSTVIVNGFNFKANVCTDNGDGTYSGKKLRIRFNIKPTASFKGGYDIKTNKPASGIYDGPDVGSVKADTIGTYPIPKVAAPMDLIVTTTGLKPNESILFVVTRSTYSDGTHRDGTFRHEILLSGSTKEKDIIRQCATKVDNDNSKAPYYYYVETQNWDWRYVEDTPSTAPSPHELYDAVHETANNVFPFTRKSDPSPAKAQTAVEGKAIHSFTY